MREQMCLYHKNRPEFNAIQKEIQKSGWISQKFIHKLAMAICSCRRHLNGQTYHHDSEALGSIKTFLYDILNKEEDFHTHWNHLKTYILQCIEEASEGDYSRCQLLNILYDSKHGDFRALQSKERTNTGSEESTTDNSATGETRKCKMTKTQIDCMIRKRKKKMDMHVVKLLMFPGNFPKLESDDELKDFTRVKNSFIETHHSLNNKSFADNASVMYVKVWTPDKENLETLTKCLMKKASSLQKELDNKRQKQIELRKQERRIRQERIDYLRRNVPDETDYVDNRKQIMRDDYNRSRNKHRAQKPANSVLDKGHCLHCHKEFTSLKDETLCKHHSGFMVKNTWNCCGKDISTTRMMKTPSYVDHQSNGCIEARTHVWRVHARSDHKMRKGGARDADKE